jgi:hypothetical protein
LSLDTPLPYTFLTEGQLQTHLENPQNTWEAGVNVVDCRHEACRRFSNCETWWSGWTHENNRLNPHGFGSLGWYFTNRGRVIKSGFLVNQRTGECLRQWSGQSADLTERECTSQPINLWSLYENGLLTNGDTHRCLTPSGLDGTGNIQAQVGCMNWQDWRWEEAGHSPTGSFLLRNWQSGQCLGYQRRRVRARTVACVDDVDLRYKWEDAGWLTPVGEWRLVGSAESGNVDFTYVKRTESSQTMTETTTITVGTEIEKGVIFSSAKVSTSVSQSLALAWSSSDAEEVRITTRCQYWDDGSDVRGPNFMWQWRQTMSNPVQEHDILWDSIYTKCTDNELPPKCPAFTRCTDPACTECKLFSEI